MSGIQSEQKYTFGLADEQARQDNARHRAFKQMLAKAFLKLSKKEAKALGFVYGESLDDIEDGINLADKLVTGDHVKNCVDHLIVLRGHLVHFKLKMAVQVVDDYIGPNEVPQISPEASNNLTPPIQMTGNYDCQKSYCVGNSAIG